MVTKRFLNSYSLSRLCGVKPLWFRCMFILWTVKRTSTEHQKWTKLVTAGGVRCSAPNNVHVVEWHFVAPRNVRNRKSGDMNVTRLRRCSVENETIGLWRCTWRNEEVCKLLGSRLLQRRMSTKPLAPTQTFVSDYCRKSFETGWKIENV